MGRSYYVPRSAKGESRILYIFTIKSFLTTLVGGLVGAIIYFISSKIVEISTFGMIFMIVPFAVIGFGIGALKIPDIPAMGPLQKAGGENVMDILGRLISFRSRKKIYIYGLNRKKKKEKKIGASSSISSISSIIGNRGK